MVGKKVLLVPLNWGLGHASRIIPLISALKIAGASVIVGGSPSHISFLQKEFENLDTLKIPYLHIRLNGRKNQVFRILLQVPALIISIVREHLALKKIVSEIGIDIVISDNCYGLWNHKVHSIFITHQLKIKLPDKIKFLENLINKINRIFIDKYDECWVPDFGEGDGIAGELSHSQSISPKTKYMGILSRFNSIKPSIKYDQKPATKSLLIIISGPEIQRTLFENIIKKEQYALDKEMNYSIIRGLPDSDDGSLPPGWFNHMSTKELGQLILESDYIICRSGYSSIMDLITLGRTALLIPTPGQTEQEYLAEFLSKNGLFATQKQELFSLKEGIRILDLFGDEYENRINTSFNCHFKLPNLLLPEISV